MEPVLKVEDPEAEKDPADAGPIPAQIDSNPAQEKAVEKELEDARAAAPEKGREKGAAAADAATRPPDPRLKEVTIMPGFDRSGPIGAGPMTGWGRGYCRSGARTSGRMAAGGFGRARCGGRGRGFGRGFGAGRWSTAYPPAYDPYVPPVPERGLESLKAEAGYLKDSLDAIHARIQELEQGEPEQ